MKKDMYTLLVIDVQQVAFDGKITPPINNGPQLLTNLATLVDGCRSHKVPVLYTQANAPSGRPYAQDAHGWEIHPSLAPRQEEKRFLKVGPSTFENPDFESTLTELGTTQLIICGIWSESCVSITARGALKRNYGVCLVTDGHGTVRKNLDEATATIAEQNELLLQRGARTLCVKDILSQLDSQA